MSAAIRPRQALRSLRAAPAAAIRAAYSHPRTFATFPDPTHPTNSQNDVPNLKPRGNNNTLLLVAVGLAAAAGGSYYYYVDQGLTDPHAQLKAEEQRLKEKAEELRDGGKATAHDAARDCQSKYEETKDKLAHARVEAGKTAEEARSAAVRQYEKVIETATGATHKVEESYDEATKKAKEEAQTWNQWLWSWFGYSKQKADEAKREGAAQVAEGAHKVETEAGKRT